MIGHYFRDLFGALSCRSWSIAQQCGAQLLIRTVNQWTELLGMLFFQACGVLECNPANRRSVAVLCKLFKIKSNTIHPQSGALPLPYFPVHLSQAALVAHRLSFAPHRCRISAYWRTFVPSQCLVGMIFVTLCLMVWDCQVLRVEPMLSCLSNLHFSFCPTIFYFSFMGWLCGIGVFGLIVFSLSPTIQCSHSLPGFHCQLIFNNNNNNNHLYLHLLSELLYYMVSYSPDISLHSLLIKRVWRFMNTLELQLQMNCCTAACCQK